jgi:hypothetical protein
MTTFNARDYLIKISNKDYLPVAARLLWLNETTDSHTIQTEFLSMADDHAIARATVTVLNVDGKMIKSATGTKREDKTHFPDFLEKAEMGAIGRALGMLGFGTQFAQEFDETNPPNRESRVVDTPQRSKTNNQNSDRNLFSAGKIKRTQAIAKNLFNLTGEKLNARILEAASKILEREITDLSVLKWQDGQKVMDELEKTAIERGVWQVQE